MYAEQATSLFQTTLKRQMKPIPHPISKVPYAYTNTINTSTSPQFDHNTTPLLAQSNLPPFLVFPYSLSPATSSPTKRRKPKNTSTNTHPTKNTACSGCSRTYDSIQVILLFRYWRRVKIVVSDVEQHEKEQEDEWKTHETPTLANLSTKFSECFAAIFPHAAPSTAEKILVDTSFIGCPFWSVL